MGRARRASSSPLWACHPWVCLPEPLLCNWILGLQLLLTGSSDTKDVLRRWFPGVRPSCCSLLSPLRRIGFSVPKRVRCTCVLTCQVCVFGGLRDSKHTQALNFTPSSTKRNRVPPPRSGCRARCNCPCQKQSSRTPQGASTGDWRVSLSWFLRCETFV
jgi:hypothetical protein